MTATVHENEQWKMQIVDLRQVFPRLQFIVSSHESLILRGPQRTYISESHNMPGKQKASAEVDGRGARLAS
jgi:predicted ATP-binding protein involved in virulence